MAADWQLLERLRSKVERAEDFIHNLQVFWSAFKVNAYPVTFKDDTKRGKRIYRLGNIEPIPVDIPWMAGDAAHNLISALDHIAYHLVSVFTGGRGPFTNVYFPVAKNRRHSQFKLARTSEHKAEGGGIIKRLGKESIEAIERIEPYQGGKGFILSYIHQLDIIDKHHMLLTVGSMNRSHTMAPSSIERYKRSGIGWDGMTPEQESVAFMTEAIGVQFPLKTGGKLATVALSEVNENMYFPFEIAFGEPKVIEGKPVLETLHQGAGLIRDIIKDFDRRGLLP